MNATATTRVDPEIDPRVAAAGGTRRRPRDGYEFRGMAASDDWRETRVHKHTSYYGCAFCGQGFKGPHAVYTHIAKVHQRRG
jgi:hypothetical protein